MSGRRSRSPPRSSRADEFLAAGVPSASANEPSAREFLALELPNQMVPSESLHFVVRVDHDMTAEELSDAIVAATSAASQSYVTPPFVGATAGTSTVKKVAALWDTNRHLVPLAMVVRQVDSYLCTEEHARSFIEGADSTKSLRDISGFRAFAVAPPPVDVAKRLVESCRDQLKYGDVSIELPIELARRLLKQRQDERRKKDQPVESLDELVFNVMVSIAGHVHGDGLQALYATDKKLWLRKLEVAIDPRRAEGAMAGLAVLKLLVFDPAQQKLRGAELAALAMLVSICVGRASGVGALGVGELLLLSLCAGVLGVRAHEVMQTQAGVLEESRGKVEALFTSKRRQLMLLQGGALLLAWLSGLLACIGNAALRSIYSLVAGGRRTFLAAANHTGTSLGKPAFKALGITLHNIAVSSQAVLFAADAGWRQVLRSHLATLMMHAPRFLGGLQLPAHPEEHREAMLAACDYATGGLHAAGFWSSVQHRQERFIMCRELLDRRVQGLGVFAEYVLLLFLPLLLLMCWPLLRSALRSASGSAKAAGSRAPAGVLLRALYVAVAVLIAEQVLQAVALEMRMPPLSATIFGASIVALAARSIAAVRATAVRRAAAAAP